MIAVRIFSPSEEDKDNGLSIRNDLHTVYVKLKRPKPFDTHIYNDESRLC